LTRLSDVKDQLLEVRKEVQDELNTIDKALDAIGVQKVGAPVQRAKRKRGVTAGGRPISQDKIDRIMRAIRTSERPMKRSEISEAADIKPDVVTKALSWLKQESMIKEVGKAPGKGHSPLYEVTGKGINEMVQDVSAGVRRIGAEEQRPFAQPGQPRQ
jgi:hypothetical protein